MSILGFLGKAGKAIAGQLPVVGGIVSNAMNAKSQKNINKQNIQYAREAYSRERADSLSDWHMQNAYNDPSAQMERLKNAGLNPNLVYGNGADAQMGAPVKPTKQQLPNLQAPDYGSIFSNAIGTMQAQANIRRTEAETQNIQANTEHKQFDNLIRERIGADKYTDTQLYQLELTDIKNQKERIAITSWLDVMQSDGQGNSRASNDPQSLIYKQHLNDYKSAKALLDIRAAESAIKAFGANLAKSGIPPDTPWYGKLIADFIRNATGVTLNDIGSGLGKGLRDFIFK